MSTPRRRRRPAAEAREAILAAAEELLCSEGPSGVRLQRVAKAVGVSHPAILHHFGSADGLMEALHHRVSRAIRDDLMGLLTPAEDAAERRRATHAALTRLADPSKGRMLAWLVATGRDPFPPIEEQGLSSIAESLDSAIGGAPGGIDQARRVVLLAVLASMGDALVGSEVRARLGGSDEARDPDTFRAWLLELVGRELRRAE